MAEEKSFADKLMDRIQKQTMINSIKEFFRRYPKAKTFLPFLRDSLIKAKEEYENYLGDSEKVIVIGRKNGETKILLIDATKQFSITTGLNIKLSPEALLANKSIESYLAEIADTGIFELITKEDEENFRKLQENGIAFENITDAFKKNEAAAEEKPEQKQIQPPQS